MAHEGIAARESPSENARLLMELRERADEFARSVGELRALSEVSRAVNSTLDLGTVLDIIVATAVYLSHTDSGPSLNRADFLASVSRAVDSDHPPAMLLLVLFQVRLRIGNCPLRVASKRPAWSRVVAAIG